MNKQGLINARPGYMDSFCGWFVLWVSTVEVGVVFSGCWVLLRQNVVIVGDANWLN
jgi:hypothetical protein